MNLVELAASKYQVVAIMDGDTCPAFDFILKGEASTRSVREGLAQMIEVVSEKGLQDVPAAWWHEASKNDRIYEFIKGPLRLFFFKGEGGQIAVCTTGIRKNGQKADKASVKKAACFREQYYEAQAGNTLRVVDYGTE